MGLHHLNCPLKIRGQVLPPGSAGVMIFLHFRLNSSSFRTCAGNNSTIANFLIIQSMNQQIKTISELFLILLRIESKHKKTAESIATVFLSCANSLFLCTHQSMACKKKY